MWANRRDIRRGEGTEEISGMCARGQDEAMQVVQAHLAHYQRLLGFQASS